MLADHRSFACRDFVPSTIFASFESKLLNLHITSFCITYVMLSSFALYIIGVIFHHCRFKNLHKSLSMRSSFAFLPLLNWSHRANVI